MRETTLTILRPLETILVGSDGRLATGIFAQIDQISTEEQIKYKAIYEFYGKFSFKAIVQWYPNSLIKQDDVLKDERFINPDIPGGATLFYYKVIGPPMNFYLDHQQCLMDVTVGS